MSLRFWAIELVGMAIAYIGGYVVNNIAFSILWGVVVGFVTFGVAWRYR